MMKKLNFSLIIKITGIVFIAFAVVLGNEIRLGIERYIKNTLETDAEATIRNLDKFSKSYTESIAANNKVNLSSSKFKSLYNYALSGDSTKVKCLVNNDGKIMNISREGIGDPNICVILDDYRGSKSWPAYFNLSTLDKKSLDRLEELLVENTETGVFFSIDTKINDTLADGEQTFYDLDIKQLKINDNIIYESDVKGDTEHIEGNVSSYMSYNIEITFPTLLTENAKISQSLTDSEHSRSVSLVMNYKDSMIGLQNQIQKNFKKFKSSGKKFATNGVDYAQYYLLTPYEYNGKYYSTIMLRLEDWSMISVEESNLDFTQEDSLDQITKGYIFVTQEYNDLTMKALQQFIMDNSSTYFLAFMLIIGICLSIGYMIVKPIRRIETTAKHIARREFDYPIDMTRHDELGELARSIDKMSKELEKTINNLHQEIERVRQLEVTRKEFVSNFTHEIKTPLGIINGFSELVELEQDENKRNEYINIIQNETKRINELVLAMLDLSKLESENISLDIEDLDLLDIVDESLESMMYLFEKKNIHLVTNLDSANMRGDRFKMEIVINNYISNALRYTDEGKDVSILLDEHNFVVENEGAHIPEEDLEKIWLTFHKVDKARNEQGTGLGLAICRAILDLHHLEYGVKNTEKGVLFYIKY